MVWKPKLTHKTCAICQKGFEVRDTVNRHKSTEAYYRPKKCLTCSAKCARTYSFLVNKYKHRWYRMGYEDGHALRKSRKGL